MRLLIIPLALAVCSLTACEHDAAASRPASVAVPPSEPANAEALDDDRARYPVLVELYTSQGCSSCPPADAMLDRLVDRSPAGTEITALAFHVDYWNDLGWRDPFSDARWSARQRNHADATGSNSVYTPQLLFNGTDRRVGVTQQRAEAAIEHASRREPAVELPLSIVDDGSTVEVTTQPRWRSGAARRPVAILAVVTDGAHRTHVLRGENSGRTLGANHVVRDLSLACVLPVEGTTQPCTTTLSVADVSTPETMKVVAFAQDRDTRQILGFAAQTPE